MASSVDTGAAVLKTYAACLASFGRSHGSSSLCSPRLLPANSLVSLPARLGFRLRIYIYIYIFAYEYLFLHYMELE